MSERQPPPAPDAPADAWGAWAKEQDDLDAADEFAAIKRGDASPEEVAEARRQMHVVPKPLTGEELDD